MTDTTETTSEVTRVAQNLTAILDLTATLDDQAVHAANDPLMPGGLSMVALASVANLEAWQNVTDTGLRTAYEQGTGLPEIDDEDDWEPPLQTLCFWSEQWRVEHNRESDRRPTLASEAAYIRQALDWAWENEVHWSDFASDIRKARARMENMLYAGRRAERGAPCLYPECKGARLTRKIDDDGERTDWHCPRCKREWNEDRYTQMVTAAHEATKFEDIDGVTWCSPDYAARDVDRSVKTIRTWINRGELSTVCLIAGRRIQFVQRDEVRARHAESKRRKKRAA